MASNQADIEALITQNPIFKNAAKATDDLLGSDIQKNADQHVAELREAENDLGQNKLVENFVPDTDSGISEKEFYRNSFGDLVDPDPSQRSMNVRDQAMSAIQNIDALVKHDTDWAKPEGFNTGVNDLDYDRFYNHPNFSQLGYSPFRDNETLYNSNASWFDDFNRMRTQWMGLAGEGFKSMLEQWKNPLDFSPNTEMAKSFEKGMGIAMSTKPGFGAKFTNFLGNSGYTVGILADLVAEEAVLVGATWAAGGLDAPITAPAMTGVLARNLARITKGTQYVKDVQAAHKASTAAHALKNLNNLAETSKFYNAARATGNFLNPLRETTQFFKTVGAEARAAEKVGKGTKKLGNMALMARGVGSFYRDVRMMNAAFAESRLEGGMVQNDMVTKLTGEWYNEHGKLPEGAEAERISRTAVNAGTKDALLNIPMIYYTNQLVLGKAFKGWAPKALAVEMTGARGGVRFLAGEEAGKRVYKGVEGIKRFGKAGYWKQAPLIITADMLRYTSANFAEGAQETFQDVVAVGAKDYYDKIYHDPALAGHRQSYASFEKGAGAQFSEQGAETFLSGFFMGALIQGPQSLLYTHGRTAALAAGEKIPTGKDAEGKPTYMVTPGTIQKIKEEKAAWIKKVEEALTSVAQNPEKYANALELNMIKQNHLAKVLQEAELSNDRHAAENAQVDGLFQHFYTLYETGHADVLLSELNKLKELDPKDLAEAMNVNNPEGDKHNVGVSQRLDKILSHAEGVRDSFEEANRLFVDDTNEYQWDPVKEADQYKSYQRRKVAFKQAKMHYAFGTFAYKNAQNRMQAVMNAAVSEYMPLAKASSTDLNILFDYFTNDGQLSTEIRGLRREIDTLKGASPESEARIPAVKEKLKHLVDLQKSLIKYDSIFKRFRSGKEVTDNELEQISKANDDLHVSYNNYLKFLAGQTGETYLEKDTQDSFHALTDYVKLSRESQHMARFVNYLHDPENFLKYVDTFDDELAQQMAKWHEANKEALEKYMSRQSFNDFINLIFNFGVFITPESVEKLAAGDYDGLDFVYATSGGPVDKESDKFLNEISPIIEAFKGINEPLEEEPVVLEDTEASKAVKADIQKEWDDAVANYYSTLPEAKAKGEEELTDEEEVGLDRINEIYEAKMQAATPVMAAAPDVPDVNRGTPIKLKSGRKAVFNHDEKSWEFINSNGNLITSRKKIDALSKELVNAPGALRVWWMEYLSNAERANLRKDFDELIDILRSGQDQMDTSMETPTYRIMEAISGVKFKTGSDVDNNTTDVNKKVWFAADGESIDSMTSLIMEDFAGYEVGLTEDEVGEAIISLVNAFPEGIKKKDLKAELAGNNLSKDLIDATDAFIAKTGLDIERTLIKLEQDLKILNYEDKSESRATQKAQPKETPIQKQEAPAVVQTPQEPTSTEEGPVIIPEPTSTTPAAAAPVDEFKSIAQLKQELADVKAKIKDWQESGKSKHDTKGFRKLIKEESELALAIKNDLLVPNEGYVAPTAAPEPVVPPTPAPVAAPVLTNIEAKKAYIEKRRQEDLDFIGTQSGTKVRIKFGNPEHAGIDNYFNSIRKIVNAKYDAELTALEKPSAPVKTVTEPAPKPTVAKGKIVYVTPGLNIQEMVANEPAKYALGDQILYQYMIDNELIDPAKTTVAQAGQIFSKLSDIWDRIPEVKALFVEATAEGKHVLTSNYWARAFAQKAVLVTDEKKLTELFTALGRTNPKAAARVQIDKEEADFIEREDKDKLELQPGATLKETLEGAPIKNVPLVTQIAAVKSVPQYLALKNRIKKMASKDVNFFNKLNGSEVQKLMDAKLNELVKSVNFANIQIGSYLLMKDVKAFPSGVAVVVDKSKGSIEVRGINKDGSQDHFKTIDISENELGANVKNIYSDELAKTTPTPTMTEEETKLSEESVKNQKDLSNDSDAMRKARESADKQSKKDVDDDFTKSLEC